MRATHPAAGAAPAQDMATFQALEDRLAQAVTDGDAAAAAALYAEDGTLVPPGTEPVRGREAIAAYWQGASEAIESIELTTRSVTPLGEGHAQEIGAYRLTMAGESAEVAGRYVMVWRETDEGWLMMTDVWN